MTRRQTLLSRAAPVALGLASIGLLASGAVGVPSAVTQQAPSPDVEKHGPDRFPDRIATTIAGDPATSRAVSWRTDDSIAVGEAQIAVATGWTEFEDDAETVVAATTPLVTNLGYVNHQHSAWFSDLEPGTEYVYRVGDAETNSWSEWIEIETASEGNEPFSFAFLGDAQVGIEEHFARVASRSYDLNSDLLVFPGDLVNVAERDQEWGEWLGAVGSDAASVPNLVALGNHEYYQLGGFRAPKSLTEYWRLQFALPDNGPGVTRTPPARSTPPTTRGSASSA